MSERRIDILVRWMEEQKEVGNKIVDKLNEISASLEKLNIVSQQSNKTMLYGLSAIYDKMSRGTKVTQRIGESTRNLNRRFDSLGRRISYIGWRLSWMAYRLMMMGRIITRWMLRPVNFAIQSLTNWERSLDTVATTMGLLAATGQLTGERQEFLQRTLEGLMEVGPKVQGAFQYVQSAMIGLAIEAGEPLSEFFFAIGDLISSLAPMVSEELIPAITELVLAANHQTDS